MIVYRLTERGPRASARTASCRSSMRGSVLRWGDLPGKSLLLLCGYAVLLSAVFQSLLASKLTPASDRGTTNVASPVV
jgi:hypothetical protein